MPEHDRPRAAGELSKERMILLHISDEVPPDEPGWGTDVAVLAASGEIDYAASPRLRAHLLGCIRAGDRHIVVDLSATTFIDSTAIGALVDTSIRLRELGEGSLRVVCAAHNERVLRIFDIAGVASVVELHRSREEAHAMLAKIKAVHEHVHLDAASAAASMPAMSVRQRRAGVGRYAEQAATAADEPSDAPAGAGRRRGVDELA